MMKNIEKMTAEEFIKKIKENYEDEISRLIYETDGIEHDIGSLAFQNGRMFTLNENISWFNELLQEIKDNKRLGEF